MNDQNCSFCFTKCFVIERTWALWLDQVWNGIPLLADGILDMSYRLSQTQFPWGKKEQKSKNVMVNEISSYQKSRLQQLGLLNQSVIENANPQRHTFTLAPLLMQESSGGAWPFLTLLCAPPPAQNLVSIRSQGFLQGSWFPVLVGENIRIDLKQNNDFKWFMSRGERT